MGIYLPNMEMPRKGQMLVTFPDGTSYVCFNGMRERLAQTTAVHVPAHGRLIDADALEKDIDKYIGGEESRSRFHHWVQVQRTVIPESEEART